MNSPTEADTSPVPPTSPAAGSPTPAPTPPSHPPPAATPTPPSHPPPSPAGDQPFSPYRPPGRKRASAARHWLWSATKSIWPSLRDYFKHNDPHIFTAFAPLLVLALILFTRLPTTNYIFDEQEALLANPYVNAVDGLGFFDAIHRDFWGLPPDRSIGSYRPIPSLLWRTLWGVSKQPFFHHLYNVILHALAGAMLGAFAFMMTRRRVFGWVTGAIFVACAVLTEAVSGIVGIADVLGGLGAILALLALGLPAWGMPLAVFGAVTFGLFSKESALVCVPLVPVVALLTAPLLHPQRPARVLRSVLALAAALGAFVLYVELRKQWFPTALPAALLEPLPEGASQLSVLYRELLVWFHQPSLPVDPLNNPLAKADFEFRVAGALRVYWRGLEQVAVPVTLSGDYSFPQEPVPKTLFGWETVAGAAMMALPLMLGTALPLIGWLRERRDRKALRTAEGPTADLQPVAARPWRDGRLQAGVLCCVAATSGLTTEFILRLRGDPSWVHTWQYSSVVLVVGIGLLIEGWRGIRSPMVPIGPWPWRHCAPAIVAVGLLWLVVSYFPHSNIPVVLPTVRAERFWYFPAIGTTLVLGLLFAWLLEKGHSPRISWVIKGRRVTIPMLLFAAFISFQCVQTYRHAMDYRDDLVFWKATKEAVPRSAKAHLNYSVMKGARNDMETRLAESKIALELAPQWAMAHVYTGDVLCRMHRPDEAWPHYVNGFELGPNERALISLGLQCLYDEGRLETYESELRAMAERHPGSWVAYLAKDTLDNHEKHHGVDPKYRPRGYNEGPKEEKKTATASATAATATAATATATEAIPRAITTGTASADE